MIFSSSPGPPASESDPGGENVSALGRGTAAGDHEATTKPCETLS
jgi:hypothetical protein